MTSGLGQPLVCPILVGRDDALRALDTALRAPPSPAVICVAGEAGVGKSRLVAEALEATRGRRVLRTANFEADRLLPLAGFLDLLQRAELDGGDRLIERIADHASHNSDMSEAERELQRRALFDDLAGALLAEDGLLVVEDLHWSDETSLDALLHLTRRSPERTCLLVTYRDDEVGPALETFLAALDRGRLAAEVPLARLDRAGVAAMTQALIGAPPEPRTLDVLMEVTEGNPYFVEEIVAWLQPGQTLDGLGTEVPVPRSVQVAVRRRLDQLGPEATELVRLAAVVGRRFDLDLLAALAELSTPALRAAVGELVGAHLAVQRTDGTVEFPHELARRAVYHRLLRRERRGLHRRVAAVLERQVTDPDVRAADLARHHQLAGQWGESLPWARRAGRRALRLNAPRAATEHFSRALEAIQRLGGDPPRGLLHERARARELVGDLEGAIADRDAALRRARAAGDRHGEWESLLALGALWISRDWDRAGQLLDQSLDLARRMNDPVAIGRSLNRRGNLHLIQGDQATARRLHEQALATFQPVDVPQDRAATLDLLAVTTVYDGDLAAARDHYLAVERAFRDQDDRPGVANALVMRGVCAGAYFVQTFVPALPVPAGIALAEEALALARQIGWHGESFVRLNLASLLCQGGRLGDGLAEAREAIALASAIEHRPWMVMARYNRGLALLDALAWEDATAELEEAVTLAESFQAGVFLAAAVAARAQAQAACGRPREAADSLVQFSADTSSLLTRRLADQARVIVHLAADEPDQALRVVDDLVATTPVGVGGVPPPVLVGLRGKAMLALGHAGEAVDQLLEARDTARRCGHRLVEWQALAGLARAHALAGDDDAAAEAARSAATAIEAITASLPGRRAATFRQRALASLPARIAATDGLDGLTPRQREVAALVAQGRTNKEIAEVLVISPLTAETHVKHILTRLGFTSRAQVAAWAVERGLVEP